MDRSYRWMTGSEGPESLTEGSLPIESEWLSVSTDLSGVVRPALLMSGSKPTIFFFSFFLHYSS